MLEDLQNDNNELKNNLNVVNDKIIYQNSEINKLKVENIKIKAQNKFRNDKIYSPNSEIDDTTPFTAYATQTRTFNKDQTVMFDGIVRNYGELYNKNTSVFTCPLNGYYLFSVAPYVQDGEEIRLSIVMGTEVLVGAIAWSGSDQGYNSVVTYCTTFTSVFVMSLYNGETMYGDPERYSTFSGTLLFEA